MDNFSCFVKGVEGELRRGLDNQELEFLLWVFQQHKQENRKFEKIHFS
ncbi:hypothetical protein [Radiobacillus sp. PE A8.2]